MKWHNYFKYDSSGYKCPPQLTYEPLISDDGNKFCMNYHPDNYYQNKFTIKDRDKQYKKFASYFFEKEIEFLSAVNNYLWSPSNVDINYRKYKIYFDWGESCNHIIQQNNNWPKKSFFYQLENLINEQIEIGFLKPTLYPHCHFLDNQGILKAFDYYSCVWLDNYFIDKSIVEVILSKHSNKRLEESSDNNYINGLSFFRNSVNKWIYWGDTSISELDITL